MFSQHPQPRDRPLNILFVGAGAIGCFYASRLHHPSKNIHVSLVCRSNYPTVSRSGVQLETHSFGTYTFSPAAVYSSISEAATSVSTPKDGWDYIVVSTKALPDITDDATDIEPVVRRAPEGRSCIVLIQNGVGIEAPHRQRFPKNPLVSVTTIVSAEQIRHGVVRQNRWTRTSLGPYSDGVGGRTAEAKDLAQRGQACTDELGELLTNYGGIEDVERYDEVGMQQVRWHKTSINAAMNPTSVLSGGRGHSSITDPDLRVHLKACMDEVWEAAERVLGAPFPEKLQAASPERILKSIEQNSGGRPSMLMDWEAGRPMEIEVILGNPVRIAKESGYEMRRLQTMYALLKSAQKVRQDARGKEKEKKKGKARQEGSRL